MRPRLLLPLLGALCWRAPLAAQIYPTLSARVIVTLRAQGDSLAIQQIATAFQGKAAAVMDRLVVVRVPTAKLLTVVDSLAKRIEVITDSTCEGPPRNGVPTCIEWDRVHGVGGVPTETALPWGLSAVRADSAWAQGDSGQGAIIVDIDSGADSLHPEFAGRIIGGYNAGAFFGGDPTAWGDHNVNCRGHGTHTMGTAGGATVGVAPAARLYAVQVFPGSGDCLSPTSAAIGGLNRAVQIGATAANISIGYSLSPSFTVAIRAAKQAGIAVCIANGNAGATSPNGPAQDSAAFGVASYGGGTNLSYFSQRGPTTDWVLPGEGVYSSVPGGYASKSGTSMATPHCTGSFAVVMARLLSVPADRRVDSAATVLTFTGDSFPDPTAYAAKLIRLDRAIAFIDGRWPMTTVGPQVFTATETRCFAVTSPGPWRATMPPVPGVSLTQSATQVCVTVTLAAAPSGTTQTLIALKAQE